MRSRTFLTALAAGAAGVGGAVQPDSPAGTGTAELRDGAVLMDDPIQTV